MFCNHQFFLLATYAVGNLWLLFCQQFRILLATYAVGNLAEVAWGLF